MRDLFYTILIAWIVWRIFNSISTYRTKQTNASNQASGHPAREGETKIDYIPPSKKKTKDNDDGEYVDYEEIK